VGLINDAAWAEYLAKQERMKNMRELLEKTRVNEAVISYQSSAVGDATLELLKEAKAAGVTLAQLLRRPEVQIEQLAPVLASLMPGFFERKAEVSCQPSALSPSLRAIQPIANRRRLISPPATDNDHLTTGYWPLATVVRNELKSVETEIKYSGYLDQQTKAIERLKKSEQRTIPEWFDYGRVSGLSREMNEKLTRVRPQTLGQASRIPGVTPAAVSLINVYIEIQARQKAAALRGA
jgi:tRNA uridine 5-carboxymethylaminomethyl modification enzyme